VHQKRLRTSHSAFGKRDTVYKCFVQAVVERVEGSKVVEFKFLYCRASESTELG
jgi:hypothetical protein